MRTGTERSRRRTQWLTTRRRRASLPLTSPRQADSDWDFWLGWRGKDGRTERGTEEEMEGDGASGLKKGYLKIKDCFFTMRCEMRMFVACSFVIVIVLCLLCCVVLLCCVIVLSLLCLLFWSLSLCVRSLWLCAPPPLLYLLPPSSFLILSIMLRR